jgi:hypothetical protein
MIPVTILRLAERFRFRSALSRRDGASERLPHMPKESRPSQRSVVATPRLEVLQGALLLDGQFDETCETGRARRRRPGAEERVVSPARMRADARMRPILKGRREPRLHGIEGEIAQGDDRTILVTGDAREAPLEQMPRHRAGVEGGCRAPMRLAGGAHKPFFACRREDEVDMDGHEAIAQQAPSLALQRETKEIAIEGAGAGNGDAGDAGRAPFLEGVMRCRP